MSDTCAECNGVFVFVETSRSLPGKEVPFEMQTLVGYCHVAGHDHDDNCRGRVYRCAENHSTRVFIRRKCHAPGCSWQGKETCFCHAGKKVEVWPAALRHLTVHVQQPVRPRNLVVVDLST